MKIDNISNVKTKLIIDRFPDNNNLEILLNKAKLCVNKEEMLECLNSISNKDITDVDIINRTYTVGDKVLPFQYLCTSEKFFLWSYLADKTKTEVWFYGFTKSIVPDVVDLYLERFLLSDYVNVVVDDYCYFKYCYKISSRGVL